MGLIRNISEWGELDKQSIKTMQIHSCPASSKLREKRKWETVLRGNFFWKGRENFMADGDCFVPFLLWREFVPASSSKILLFCSKSLKQQTLNAGKRSNSVPVAIRFVISLLYHENQTVAFAGVIIDSQLEDKKRCYWFRLGELGMEDISILIYIYIYIYLIEFQTGTKNFLWRYVHLSPSPSQYIQMENFLEIYLRMRATSGFQEISVQMNEGLWHLHAFLLGSLFWPGTCGYIYFLCFMWDDCVSNAVNIIGTTCKWFPLGFKSALSSLLNDSL